MIRFLTLFLFIAVHGFCDTVVWSGTVHSDGTPSPLIPLELHKKYAITVSGYVNLGKWVQGGEKLANDACYEFNKERSTTKAESLRNSGGISVCFGEYQPSHIYRSAVFQAKQDRIHFWVHDTTYEDNSGEFTVEVVEISNEDTVPFLNKIL